MYKIKKKEVSFTDFKTNLIGINAYPIFADTIIRTTNSNGIKQTDKFDEKGRIYYTHSYYDDGTESEIFTNRKEDDDTIKVTTYHEDYFIETTFYKKFNTVRKLYRKYDGEIDTRQFWALDSKDRIVCSSSPKASSNFAFDDLGRVKIVTTEEVDDEDEKSVSYIHYDYEGEKRFPKDIIFNNRYKYIPVDESQEYNVDEIEVYSFNYGYDDDIERKLFMPKTLFDINTYDYEYIITKDDKMIAKLNILGMNQLKRSKKKVANILRGDTEFNLDDYIIELDKKGRAKKIETIFGIDTYTYNKNKYTDSKIIKKIQTKLLQESGKVEDVSGIEADNVIMFRRNK